MREGEAIIEKVEKDEADEDDVFNDMASGATNTSIIIILITSKRYDSMFPADGGFSWRSYLQ
jgi:hypothetical protein